MSVKYSPCSDCVPRCCRVCSLSSLRNLLRARARTINELSAQKSKTKLKVKLSDALLSIKDDVLIDFVILSRNYKELQSFNGKKKDFVSTIMYQAFMCEWLYSLELVANWHNGYVAKLRVKLEDKGGPLQDEIQS